MSLSLCVLRSAAAMLRLFSVSGALTQNTVGYVRVSVFGGL